MARGQQKIQSQQKSAKKHADKKKQQGHDQKTAAKAALVHTCTVCKAQMPDPKTYRQHFESKHPKVPLPSDLAEVEAVAPAQNGEKYSMELHMKASYTMMRSPCTRCSFGMPITCTVAIF
uniref:Zinc finger protein 706 n=1 Tax=Eptatretus burgeri TaxID=7764 RepID=A0A8C4QHF1_EPTBU